MAFDIEVTGDLAGVITLPKQMTFAAASSLTKVAKRAQKLVIEQLPQDFVIRGDWYQQNRRHGIKVKAAAKTNLEAQVHTSADWLLEAEGYHGGVKRPDKGGTNLAQPDIEHTRHGLRNPVKRNEKARSLLNRSSRTKAFKIKTKSGAVLIMQRVGLDDDGNFLKSKRGEYLRGRGKKRKSDLVVKYFMRKSAKVPYKPVVTRTTRIAVALHYGSYYSQELRLALKNAKIK